MAEASSSRAEAPSTRPEKTRDTVDELGRLLSLEAAAFQRDLEVRLICFLHDVALLYSAYLQPNR